MTGFASRSTSAELSTLDASSPLSAVSGHVGAVGRSWRRPETLFLVFMLVFGSAMTFITPPMQVPDEPDHLFRAWQLSTGIIVRPDHTGDIPTRLARLNDYLEIIRNKEVRVSPHSILQDFHRTLNPRQALHVRFDNSSLYSPAAYLPQTIGVLIARKFNWPAIAAMYLGRVASVIGYALLGWLTIRVTPVLKWPMVVSLLSPMAVFMAASVSADPMTTAIAFLAAALCLRMILAQQRPPRGIAIGLAVTMFALSLSKPAYVPLLLLLAVIPARNWNARRWWLWPAGISALSLVIAFAWSAAVHPMSVRESGGGIPPEQLRYVLHSPGKFVAIMLRTLHRDYLKLAQESVGVMGWEDAPMPRFFAWVYMALLVWLALNHDEPISIPFLARMCALGAIVASALLIVFANYLVWSPPGNPFVEGLQGRYFIPLAPLMLMLVQRRRRFRVAPVWIAIAVTASILLAFGTMIFRYYLYLPSPF